MRLRPSIVRDIRAKAARIVWAYKYSTRRFTPVQRALLLCVELFIVVEIIMVVILGVKMLLRGGMGGELAWATGITVFILVVVIGWRKARHVLSMRRKRSLWQEQKILRAWDAFLLAALLIGKVGILIKRWNVQFGYDDPGHLENLSLMNWHRLVLPVRETLYSYHMPVGFWLAKTWTALGVPSVAATQIAAFISVILSYLFLRLTLRRLDLLQTPAGLFFLYFTTSMPMWVYLISMITLDVHVLAVACATLCLSTYLALAPTAKEQLRWASLLAPILLIGLFIKYSVLLLLPLPLIATFMFRGGRMRERVLSKAMLIAAGIGLVVSLFAMPGYYFRYKAPTGMWLYSKAEDIYMGDMVKEARAERDRNPLATLHYIAWPAVVGGKLMAPDLTIIWMSFWLAFDKPPQSGVAEDLSAWYNEVAWILAVAGFLLWVVGHQKGTRWYQLGAVLLCAGLLHIAASTQYAYRFPVPGHFTTKGIYVAFVSVTGGYLVTFFVSFLIRRRFALHLSFVFLALWILGNHLLPVY